MKQIVGIFIKSIGIIAAVAAVGLTAYNSWDAARAASSARQTSWEISERIGKPEAKPKPARPVKSNTGKNNNSEEPVGEAPLPSEPPLIEIDGELYLGLLSIPALSLELPINNELDDARLKKSPCRYTGGLSGGLVISAHNYKSHFGGISKLSPGAEVVITDALGEEHRYTVEVITRLRSTDIEGMINSPYELTLFTCPAIRTERITVRCVKER